jgi:tetratricopeptide (TPR) repeat protein
LIRRKIERPARCNAEYLQEFGHKRRKKLLIHNCNSVLKTRITGNKMDPQAEEHLRSGTELLKDGLWEDAVHELSASIKIDPDHHEAYYHLGLALMMLGHLNEAKSSLACALTENPYLSDAKTALAKCLIALGDHETAESLLLEVLENDSGNLEAIQTLAVFYNTTGQPESAASVLLKEIERRPTAIEFRSLLGHIYTQNGLHEAAVNTFTAACSIRPHDLNLQCSLSMAKSALGQHKEAIQILKQASRNPRAPALVYYLLGLGHLDLEQYDEACSNLERARDLEPNSLATNQNLEHLYRSCGETDKAERCRAEILRLSGSANGIEFAT